MKLIQLPGHPGNYLNPDYIVSVEPFKSNDPARASLMCRMTLTTGDVFLELTPEEVARDINSALEP